MVQPFVPPYPSAHPAVGDTHVERPIDGHLHAALPLAPGASGVVQASHPAALTDPRRRNAIVLDEKDLPSRKCLVAGHLDDLVASWPFPIWSLGWAFAGKTMWTGRVSGSRIRLSRSRSEKGAGRPA